MSHLVLLGDSVFDNGAYTGSAPDVATQLRGMLPRGWRTTLAAQDGATTDDVAAQLERLPPDATHLVLSAGGNDAMMRAEVLDAPVRSSAQALELLADAAASFEAAYRRCIDACLARGLPLIVSTIYNGNFSDAGYQRRVTAALCAFNDAILRVAVQQRLAVLDLRLICSTPADYANPIEPSAQGGAKIAQAIVHAVTQPGPAGRGALLLAG
jgi:hypothetical protein